jgi:hypothetical protein
MAIEITARLEQVVANADLAPRFCVLIERLSKLQSGSAHVGFSEYRKLRVCAN